MAKTAHLIGICGAGMSAVAHLLQQSGYTVSGSDADFYPPVSDYLKKIGLPCHKGYAAANIPHTPNLIVIGKNAKLTPDTNEEVKAALETYPQMVRSFPEVLASLTENKERIVVAGSYGKSTLASLISWCLIDAGCAPGYFIGAIPKNFDASSDIGTGPQFIFEGDEYPSANWDKRAKFLHYAPQTLLLTSACHDHVNIYPTLKDYHAPFYTLCTQLEENAGTLITCLAEHNAATFHETYGGSKISYGTTSADFYADMISLSTESQFGLFYKGKNLGMITTQLLGKHNIENIVGAAACLLGQNYITFAEFQKAIATFTGLARRLDLRSGGSALPVYEGFGSSYEKARAAINAIKDHYPNRRITLLFEPHTFTWRNRATIDQYDTAFKDTNRVMIYPPPTQGAKTHDQLTQEDIIERARIHHPHVTAFTVEQFPDQVKSLHSAQDIVLILSSGSFDGNLERFVSHLNAQFS